MKSFESLFATSPIELGTIEQVFLKYDYFIIDQWGVLHNGKVPYDGVLDCIRKLKEAGKTLLLLSNSSRRKSSSFKGLRKIGIAPEVFDDIVTSGELAHKVLNGETQTIPFNVHRKYALIGNGVDDLEYMASASCLIVHPNEADAILVRGTQSIFNGSTEFKMFSRSSELLDIVDPWLRQCSLRHLPMLVSNPDFFRPGTNDAMPGVIAQRYKDLDSHNQISFIGKPYPAVYEECYCAIIQHIIRSETNEAASTEHVHSLLNNQAFMGSLKAKICCIGDSLDHDILGARNQGLDSIFIVNGVHREDMLNIAKDESVEDRAGAIVEVPAESDQSLPHPKILQKLFEKFSYASPSYYVSSFH